MRTEIVVAAISGALSCVLTGVVRQYALRRGVLDIPNARSSHRTPTPRGGGAAIIAAATIGMATGVELGLTSAQDAFTLGFGMIIIGAIGWEDDRRGMRADVRLAVHIGVALWTLYMFRGLPVVRFGTASVEIGDAGYFLGVLGIVWCINLYNFMDGIDGLAGSQAVLIFAITGLLLLSCGDNSLGALSLILATSAAGFLVWNWPPARIFLGDAGSGAIGYAVAAIAVAAENHGSVPLVAFAVTGGVFIADATVTLLRRILRRNSLAKAHRDHAYQRLAQAYGSHKSVSLQAAVVTIVLGGLGAVGTAAPRMMLVSLFVACLLLASLLFATERLSAM